MRTTEHFKKHLSVRTQIDNKTISDVPIEDPFHHTTVSISLSWRDWFLMLFGRRCEVRVKVCADGVAIGRWFQGADICEQCQRTRIDTLGNHETKPGYEHADERWCEDCYYKFPVASVAHSFERG